MKANSTSADPSPAGEHIEMSNIIIESPAFEESRIDLGGNAGGKPNMSMAGNAVSSLDEWPSVPPITVADVDAGAAWGLAYGWRSSGSLIYGHCSASPMAHARYILGNSTSRVRMATQF